MTEPLLEVENLTVQYRRDGQNLTAVSNVSFELDRGEYFGLVGESGCGKSTLAHSILGALDSNGKITSGQIRYKGREIQNLSTKELNDTIRWEEIAWIPQGSMNSLDPLRRIKSQAIELAQIHRDVTKHEALEDFEEILDVVGIQEDRIHSYPHELSGGMKQRVIIALGLFLDSSLIVADEPTTALDVIMQDQIFKYMDEINRDFDVSFLLITHDISLVFESCDRVGVMHSGQLVETGTGEDIFDEPHHPYSILLQRAFPDHEQPNKLLKVIEGNPPETLGRVDYCTFADRCPYATDRCREDTPPIETVDTDHTVACFHHEEVASDYSTNKFGQPTRQTKGAHSGGGSDE